MTKPEAPSADEDRRWHDQMNQLAAIRGRAQATRRRVGRVKRLSRAHIAADLAQIEAAADRLVALLAEERDGRGRQGGEHG